MSFCNHMHDKVVDSRERQGGRCHPPRRNVRMRRRFTTYERIDEVPYMVVKKDGPP